VSYEQIWAPWRLEYLEHATDDAWGPKPNLTFQSGADPECFLCQGVADPDNPGRHVVERGQLSVAVLNRYPYNNGHVLVAPNRHCGRLHELTSEEQLALSRAIIRMIGVLEKILRPEGFNVGLNLGKAAGAGVPGHLHWHIVPRWSGDTNFMLTTASTKVIPQALDRLWQTLTATLREGR
jgi:ATP adenylyltransferase